VSKPYVVWGLVGEYYTVVIPRRLAELPRERGLDPEVYVVDVLIEKLKVGPDVEAALRVEVAEWLLEEARRYTEAGDAVQASEKLYGVAEECIKALARHYRIPELGEVEKRGKWEAWILGKAATRLAVQLGEERIRAAWAYAYDIHVWGFHEAKYEIEEVKHTLPYIDWLLEYTRRALKQS